MRERRPPAFWCLAALFALFVLFLYGPTLTILVLSFQGPYGGLTFPMNGVSTHWFSKLWDGLGVVDIWAAFGRSMRLGLDGDGADGADLVARGLCLPERFRGRDASSTRRSRASSFPRSSYPWASAWSSGSSTRAVTWRGESFGIAGIAEGFTHQSPASSHRASGAHLTWTLPFGLLIMFAVFNRFDRRYEEAARDLGSDAVADVRHVILPIIAPSLVGVGLFGFTLSWDEVARSSQAFGSDQNTLPLELPGLTTTVTKPEIYALGTVTTGVSS